MGARRDFLNQALLDRRFRPDVIKNG